MKIMSIDYDKLKIEALEEAISYPTFKEEKDGLIIEVDEFNSENIYEKVKNNEQLSHYEGADIDLIIEMVKLLENNIKKFKIDLHNYIGFYFRGLHILTIKVNKDMITNRRMYISVKVYKDELKDKITEKKINRGVFIGVGTVLALGGIISLLKLYKGN